MSDVFDGIIVGAAAAAIGTIVAIKFLNHRSFGGGEPNQTLSPADGVRSGGIYVLQPAYTPYEASPLAQNSPITEASYNTGDIGYEPAFHTNYAVEPALLPQ